MSHTAEYTVDNSDWTTVITGQSTGFIQLKDAGPVLVQVGQTAPSSDSLEGVILNTPGLTEMAFLALEENDEVYAKSLLEEDNRVTVIAPGALPGA